jgi:hypothetical protein
MDEPKAVNEHERSATTAGVPDRRRPGRVEYRNASLIQLLRRASHARARHADVVPDETDDLDADASDGEHKVPLGIALACIVLTSVLLWALVGIGVRLLLG